MARQPLQNETQDTFWITYSFILCGIYVSGSGQLVASWQR